MDIGANVGSYAILAGGGAGARVTTVEPIPSTFASVQRNLLLNGLGDSVRSCQVGLSGASGTLRFSSGLDTVNHVLAAGESLPGIDVPVTRLDDLVPDDAPVLIKIDVEGHELAVLRGARETLGNTALLAVILETNDSGTRSGVAYAELFAITREHGFEPFGYDPFARHLVDASQAGGNTVFVRDRAGVEERVKSARKFRLVNGLI